MELTKGIFKAAEDVFRNNKGSILRTIVYTIGHFAIAITVLMLVADVSFLIALTDAIVEPLANAVWYFILKKWVPELKRVPSKFIHKPWEMELKYQNAIKTIIGKDYPKPIVIHEVARQSALSAFQTLKK